jgi:hypothetical protein
MKSYEFNLAQLKAIAVALGDLLQHVTFVGVQHIVVSG